MYSPSPHRRRDGHHGRHRHGRRGTSDAEKTRAAAEAQHRATSPGRAGLRAAEPGEVATPTFSMTAVDKATSNLYLYFPNRQGGFDARYDVGVTYDFAGAVVHVDNDKDGYGEGTWNFHKDGLLSYVWSDDVEVHVDDIGRGWQIYNKVLSPGNLGGTQDADLMAVDKSGVMWTYVGHAGTERQGRRACAHRQGLGRVLQIAGRET